jgi:serine/threonine protein phosphatase 1
MDQKTEEKIFAVGDIHGCHAQLVTLLNRIPVDKERDTIIFLGDYINRGPDSRKVLDTLVEIRHTYAHPVFLKGNHEQALLDYAETGDVDMVPFLRVMGVEATAASYGARVRNLQNLACFPPDHQAFLRTLRFSYSASDFLFTHADITDEQLMAVVSGRPASNPDRRLETALLSSRRLAEQKNAIDGITIVFGHSPFQFPLVLPDRICIDTGAVYGNVLTAVELPRKQFYHA